MLRRPLLPTTHGARSALRRYASSPGESRAGRRSRHGLRIRRKRLKEHHMEDVVIVAALRTAVGKFGGTLARIPAADLGAHVIKALMSKTGIKPDQVSEVILGQVLTSGVG